MLDAELTIVGPQGPIRGAPGPRGGTAIAVLEVRHTLVAPRDASGQPVGRRRHAPLTVVKDVDRSSPQLLAAWARNDVLSTWQLDVFKLDQIGRRRSAYTLQLQRARVAEVAVATPESATFLREAVAFVYESISWTWHEGAITTSDEWGAAT